MLRKSLLVAGLVALAGCPQPLGGLDGGEGGGSGATGGGSGGSGGSGAGGGEGVGGGSGGGPAFAQSAKGLVRFKRNERLLLEMAKGLGLPPQSVCNELGQYPCATTVHHVALGGVDAYNIGLYEPVASTGLTTPLVVDRMAISACTARVKADLATPSTALIFKGVTLDAAGKLANVEAAEVKASLNQLYKQVLLRQATDAEVGHLKQLYADIVATNKPEAGKMWMAMSCFAVLTSVESVFY